MMTSSCCGRWVLAAAWLMATAACLAGHDVVDAELNWTNDEHVDVDDEFQDVLVDRRSLNLVQSSLEGMCRWTMCPPSSVCRLRRGGRARCVCRPCAVTDLHSGPVCGFDGRTYSSACRLHRANCRSRQHTNVDYSGPCQTSCGAVSCPTGKSCIVDQLGLPHCMSCDAVNYCPWDSSDRSPVCGADGRTYTGRCRLLQSACHAGRSIRLAYRGPCQAGLTCDELECEVGERCVMNEATSTPMCVECTRPCYSTTLPGVGTAYQLCGTDGHTYHDWCSVERETCSRRVFVETRHFGPCQRDENDGLQLG